MPDQLFFRGCSTPAAEEEQIDVQYNVRQKAALIHLGG